MGNTIEVKSQPTAAAGAKKSKVMLLDLPRARNIGILLGSLRVKSYEVIAEAVKKVDDNILTSQRLNILKQCVPTDDEVELIKSYDGKIEDLGNAEQFIAVLAQVPRFQQRIQAMAFRQKFSEELSEVGPDLETVRQAIQAVRTSSRFKKVLQAILVIGNFVNAKSFRGNAYGFYLESVSKLRDLTCSHWADNRERAPTLLHYVARRLDEVDSDLVDLKDELAQVELASKGDKLRL
jgi:hypothetical protein